MKAQCPCEKGAVIGLNRVMLMEVAKHISRYSGRLSRPIILLINENLVDPHRPEFPLRDLVTAIIGSGTMVCAIDLETPFGKYITALRGIAVGTGIGHFLVKDKFFDYFADLTGGLVVKDDTGNPERAVQEITTFFERVRRSYILGFEPKGERSKGRLVKIKVELSSQARKKNEGVQLRYRRGYIVLAGEEQVSK